MAPFFLAPALSRNHVGSRYSNSPFSASFAPIPAFAIPPNPQPRKQIRAVCPHYAGLQLRGNRARPLILCSTRSPPAHNFIVRQRPLPRAASKSSRPAAGQISCCATIEVDAHCSTTSVLISRALASHFRLPARAPSAIPASPSGHSVHCTRPPHIAADYRDKLGRAARPPRSVLMRACSLRVLFSAMLYCISRRDPRKHTCPWFEPVPSNQRPFSTAPSRKSKIPPHPQKNDGIFRQAPAKVFIVVRTVAFRIRPAPPPSSR